MFSRSQKWVSVLAVTALSSSLLVGCGDGDGKTEQKKSDNGKTAAQGEARGAATVSLYDRGRVPAEEGTMDKNRWTDWVNTNGPTNVKYVLIPRTDSITKFNTLFASGDVPDVINEYEPQYRDLLYQQKQLLPLDDLIDKYAPNYKQLLAQYPQLKKAGTKPDGKLYEIGRLQGTMSMYSLIIRADWLKKLNLQMPQTPEDLFKIAKAFTEQDPDGDGKKNTYGISLASDSGMGISKMYGDVGWVVKDGKFVYDWDRAKASNEFKKRLFDEGVVDKDYLTDKNGEKAKQDWLSGKLGMYVMQHSQQLNPGLNNYQTLKKNVPSAEILPVPLPKTQFGQFSMNFLNPAQMTTVVYRGAKDPVAAIKYIDFMASKETAKVMKYGLEGSHWKQEPNGCPIPVDMERNKKELVYVPDLAMQTSPDLVGACNKTESSFDPKMPDHQAYLTFIKQAREAYETPERPMPDLTLSEHMPTLPADLAKINTDLTQQISGFWAKSIVSGSAYTIDKALSDAKAVWEKGGGKQLEDWYAKWYVDNKDKAFLTQDIYKFLNK
ncbi:extracellular solute-binding protein [Paenibacillus sp. LMG 31456]|uniref:Extracellular solute-binding protein n=1 Tax=Paenibacillus foliorum TaxID=2654974 RepID=A0A972K3Z3_9BACL|nr:extracellular solute-binding protein [Paenibacillus foliorum]NOU97495.1 extracellular solute-binding protein [Paenibacillus foliorum]